MPKQKNQSRSIESRREFLVRALGSGAFIGGLGWQNLALANWFSRRAARLPEGRSVYAIQGEARLDGQRITHTSRIPARGRIEVDTGSQLIFAVGDGAFVLREKSTLVLAGEELLVRSLRLLSGAVLSVFGRRQPDQLIQARTPVATLGIRGTGFYLTAEPDRSYVCNCYGTIDLSANGQSLPPEQLVSRHHDEPRWVYAPGVTDGPLIQRGGFIDHSDLELMTIEALVGREVPFFLPDDNYGGPRRDY